MPVSRRFGSFPCVTTSRSLTPQGLVPTAPCFVFRSSSPRSAFFTTLTIFSQVGSRISLSDRPPCLVCSLPSSVGPTMSLVAPVQRSEDGKRQGNEADSRMARPLWQCWYLQGALHGAEEALRVCLIMGRSCRLRRKFDPADPLLKCRPRALLLTNE
jgi:hypothetical protein